MSGWLGDGEVLEAQGSGQASPRSPRFRTPTSGRGARPSPDSAAFQPPQETMRKAKELFGLCDKEKKGFITKRDLQRLQGEVPLTPEQLESVFESLDRDRNGFLTPLEFHTGLGELVEECEEKDPAELRFTQILIALGADKLLKEREDDHDRVVRSLYEDLENQLKEEREKRLTLDGARQGDRREQLLQELRMREQELEFTLTKQKELETRIKALCQDQANTRGQNQRLQLVNADLREQLEVSREELQKALNQLQILQETLTDQQEGKQRQVLKVSRNMQKERESLMRQLDLLKDMNRRLRDEKDAQQDQKRTPKMKRPLEKKGSVIGDYLLAKKPGNRQVSFVGQMKKSSPDVIAEAELTLSEKNHEADTYSKTGGVSGPKRVFKVVFLGSSGVGKSSFIHHYCRGHFPNKMSTTVGMDFQVRSLVLDSTQIALQLWDTAGQERFHSITTQYYRKADGILVMYDVTQTTSLLAVRDWLDQVQKNMADGACVMLLGNKMDMEDGGGRQVTTMQGQKLAEEYQAEFFECSAKSGYNIQEAMTHLARLMGTQQDEQCESVLHSLDNSSQRGHCCT
ncbi:EF-hand calcium-binding domain-containing protein 4A isoform X2 [Neoarius graeffei]|uniref:EF-hand calcium-binding domain-containing protein 4A isoform X2 n=1 Tax=Neoarius graeffei TaxID=443677 RepID=UPI00298C575D|nr:EF-hand calcium-binding domain-containing protein 4A isoform X2 [Neoarius graeffei]